MYLNTQPDLLRLSKVHLAKAEHMVYQTVIFKRYRPNMKDLRVEY